MSLVAFLDLAGLSVMVESENVLALNAIPTALLPTGVPFGTRISLGGGVATTEAGSVIGAVAYQDVRGTVAGTGAALASGVLGARVLAFGVVDGGTGNLLAGIGTGIASALRNAAGDYTVTASAAIPAGAFPFATPADGGGNIAATDGPPAGTNFDVKTFDAAGVAADVTFFCAILATN